MNLPASMKPEDVWAWLDANALLSHQECAMLTDAILALVRAKVEDAVPLVLEECRRCGTYAVDGLALVARVMGDPA